jgi:DNA-binding LacI/PurR family transcriptional regulator
MEASIVKLRPTELVKQFVEDQFLRFGGKEGARLPTIQRMAEQLNVSPSTVQNVYKGLMKTGRIRSVPGGGTYVARTKDTVSDSTRIGINLHLPSEEKPGLAWGDEIVLGILRESARSGSNLFTQPLSSPSQVMKTDGAIIFPGVAADEWRSHYLAAQKPWVNINPFTLEDTANFVSADFFHFCERLGRTWRETGRRHLLIYHLEASSTSRSLCDFGLSQGFRGIHGHDDGLVFEHLVQPKLSPDLATDVLKNATHLSETVLAERLRNGKPVPDAIFCVGDWLAIGAFRALTAFGLKVPEEVSLVGGTGLDFSLKTVPGLSLMRQPMSKIGAEAVKMLTWRLQNGGIAVPGIFVPSQLVGGATTRSVENEKMGWSN